VRCGARLRGDASIAELFGWIQQDGGTLYDGDIMREYDRLIESAKVNALSFLSRLPATEVVVKEDPVGGFYQSAPRDGSLPAAFGAQTTGAQLRFTMPTLAYHETIPGHHVQIALAQEMDLPLLLSETGFLGFNEGWALYAERLAWEFGWYEGDPYGNLGRLQFELMRAARLVVDTGIHALGWSYEDAAAAYQEATGRSPQLTQSDITDTPPGLGKLCPTTSGTLPCSTYERGRRPHLAIGLTSWRSTMRSFRSATRRLRSSIPPSPRSSPRRENERWKRRGVCRRVASCWDLVADVPPLDRVGCWVDPLVEGRLPRRLVWMRPAVSGWGAGVQGTNMARKEESRRDEESCTALDLAVRSRCARCDGARLGGLPRRVFRPSAADVILGPALARRRPG